MDKWPASLPCPLLAEVDYTSRSNVIRTEMDAGIIRMRRRYTSVPENVSFSLLLTRAQLQVLFDFVSITLGDVGRFEWKEFRDPARRAAIYRFQDRPTYMPATPTLWRAAIKLDLMSVLNGQHLLANDLGAGLVDRDDNGLTS